MSERPYQPFYKPYGMTDEEYEYEKRIAAEELAEWERDRDESSLLSTKAKESCYFVRDCKLRSSAESNDNFAQPKRSAKKGIT